MQVEGRIDWCIGFNDDIDKVEFRFETVEFVLFPRIIKHDHHKVVTDQGFF